MSGYLACLYTLNLQSSMLVSDKWLADHNKTNVTCQILPNEEQLRPSEFGDRLRNPTLSNWHTPLVWTFVVELNL
jgi:hypothetical protein